MNLSKRPQKRCEADRKYSHDDQNDTSQGVKLTRQSRQPIQILFGRARSLNIGHPTKRAAVVFNNLVNYKCFL
jgi:hypothetical protein